MKWTGSLIRIAEHEIEGLRIRVAEIVERRVAVERKLVALGEEAVAESRHAAADAQAGWYLAGFRQGLKLRKDKVLAELASIQQEEQGAREALAQAFEGLKKVENVAEAARVAAEKERARREGQALDEIALRQGVRR
jgi:flagellar FliJ protein